MVAPRTEARAQAVALRQEGRSYSEIAALVGCSMSSLSLWLRDVPLTDEQRAHLRRGQPRGAAARREQRLAQTRSLQRIVAAQVGAITDRELFLLGVALYWCEGAKAKPWTPSEQVTFINSDPDVIRLFLAWLRLLGVGADDLVFRVAIHESADVVAATRFWSDLVGVDPDRFRRPTLKRHNPKTRRRNTGDRYVGCLVVRVRRSCDLNRRIAGWWRGIANGIVGAGTPVGIIAEPSGMV